MTGDGETGRDDLEHQVGSPLVDGQIATAKHTRSLIQGVVNTFVISLARIVGYVVDRPLAGDSEEEHQGAGIGFWITSMVAELFLGLLASMVVMWFSRPREFRADAGGARLARRRKMIAALEIRRLQRLLLPEASCDLSRGNARVAPRVTVHAAQLRSTPTRRMTRIVVDRARHDGELIRPLLASAHEAAVAAVRYLPDN